MKRRREVICNNTLLFGNNIVRITKSKELLFEIKNEVTTDLAEAVAIMMRMDIKNIWDIELEKDIISIEPAKCLYWLSGGDKEWLTLDHYNKPWVNYYLQFQEEFGFMVIEIIKNAKAVGDIRDGFIKYLNLPTLYDFAISQEMVR